MLSTQPARQAFAIRLRPVGCLCACENPVCPEEHVAHPPASAGHVRATFLRSAWSLERPQPGQSPAHDGARLPSS